MSLSAASSGLTPVDHLAATDPRMAELIARIGVLDLPRATEPFEALARSITSQQLSMAAADTIWKRVCDLGEITPEGIAGMAPEDMRAAGLSWAKVAYLHDLASRALDGSLDFLAISVLPDEEVIKEVSAVKGIGRWSAEVFLIFALGRPDVLALDDAGLLRAAGWLFGLPRSATGPELSEAGEAWRPYRSLASLYLWRAIGEGLVRRP
jgi:DNA-3-methyladenine glycosylase II